MNITICRDLSDAVALYLPQRLYLKSFAKIHISVQLPTHKVSGKAISNWELTEKLRKMILPDSFSLLKVTKHSAELIRYEAELENREKLERVLSRLGDRVVQLNDYPDALKIRVSEAKSEFPSRHSWDSFFRDATDMDEMKPGERPDTIHITNLPIRWFVSEKDLDDDSPPSEHLFKKVFEKYGPVRQVDVPAADPFRMQMKSSMRGITISPQDAQVYFEGYIQYSEYVSFVRCMDALRGRKLMKKRDDVAEWCGIKVDFDKSKHMTDAAVKRRAIVRERLMSRQKAKDEEERMAKEKIAKKEAKERQKYERSEREKLVKMKEREERRKKKQLAKLMEQDNVDLNSKVADEKKKLLKEQKKLQAIRLIEELLKRIELRPDLQPRSPGSRRGGAGERAARARLVDRFKRTQEDALEAQRNHLKCALDGRIVIRSALETKKPRRPSLSSASSEEEHQKRIKTERLTTPEREMQHYKSRIVIRSALETKKPRRPSLSSASSEEEHQKRIKTERLTTPEREMQHYKNMHLSSLGLQLRGLYPFMGAPAFPFPQSSLHYPPEVYPPDPQLYYPVRGAYYPPPDTYAPRRARGRGRGRGRPYRHPGAGYNHYRNDGHDDRDRVRSRSRSRSRRRSYSRSPSRSRRRSRSRSRRSRSSRRERSRSRRSRSHRSRSRSHSRSRSRRRSRSRSARRSRSPSPKQRSASPKRRSASPKRRSASPKRRSASPKRRSASPKRANGPSPSATPAPRRRSKSWSLPKENEKAWSQSPKDNADPK